MRAWEVRQEGYDVPSAAVWPSTATRTGDN